MPSNVRTALSGLSLGWVLLVAGSAQAQVNTVHKLGVLTAADPQLEDRSHFDSYEIAGSAGDRVSISLDSSAFDAFLGLLDSDGNLVASNDDASEGNLNSFLSVTLPQDGVYTVVATSLVPQTVGDYRLALRNFNPPQSAANPTQAGLQPVVSSSTLDWLTLFVGAMLLGGDGGSNSGYSEEYPEYELIEGNRPNQPDPAPTPITPIGGNSGFYGSDHTY